MTVPSLEEIVAEAPHRGDEADVVEDRGAEQDDGAADLLEGGVGDGEGALGEADQLGRALGALDDQLEVDADRGERLTGGVVELAGDDPALGLLQQHGPRGQLAQVLLLGLQLGVGGAELGA
jgi:hypothetical protein